MKNWSGNQNWTPKSFYQPATKDEIKTIVLNASKENAVLRVYGTKHSFTGLNNTNSIALNLDNYQGIIAVNDNLVTVKSGTKLHLLTKLLDEHNLALENMGDVDVQSIAGAIGTGTHGTGLKLGNISTQVVSISFINGLGEEVFCSETENSELFKCMQVSLGAFGVVTEVTLRCVKQYNLHLEKKVENLDTVLQNLDQLNSSNRNFEFFWLPYTDKVQTKYSNITDIPAKKPGFLNYLNDVVVENYTFKILCEITRLFPKSNAFISELSSKFLSDSLSVELSKDVYATPRIVKFNEMEYNIPIDAYKDCIKDIKNLVNSKKFNISFPIENRFVLKDDIYMSPSYQRDSAYIACHVYKGKPYEDYFFALEEIFSNYDGRPHWGKLHFKDADYLSSAYPMFSKFNELRKEHDPTSIFVNDYLKRILL